MQNHDTTPSMQCVTSCQLGGFQGRQLINPPSAYKAVHDSSLHCVCREACKLDPKYITNFGEEVVRGQPVFVLSLLLQRLEPILREAAGVAPWQVKALQLFVPAPSSPFSGVRAHAFACHMTRK